MCTGVMSAKLILDKAGRVVLPKSLCNELHLALGETLDLTVAGEEITLHARRAAVPLQKERGVWLMRTGDRLTGNETSSALRRIREERGRGNVRNSG